MSPPGPLSGQSPARTLWGVYREAVVEAASRPVWSLLIVTMIGGMCVATLLTSGRTEAAEAAALAQIDAEGTRTLVVRAAADAGLDATVVGRIRRIDGVEMVVAFGPITDARNGLVAGAPRVPVRRMYGDLIGKSVGSGAYASHLGAEALGLRDGTGLIAADDGRDLVVRGTLDTPQVLADLEPLVVVPVTGLPPDPVVLLIVVVDEPREVAAVSGVVVNTLQLSDPTKATIETSVQLASVRAAVSGELRNYGRATVLGILGVAGALVAASLLGLVQMRRKDFGRRRALGASQSLIVALVLTEVLQMGVVGALLGTAATLVSLGLSGAALPTARFVLAVGIASVVTGVLAALLPAAVASRRDPLYELRVP